MGGSISFTPREMHLLMLAMCAARIKRKARPQSSRIVADRGGFFIGCEAMYGRRVAAERSDPIPRRIFRKSWPMTAV